eukprot:3908254-Rhodomonas_salina.1
MRGSGCSMCSLPLPPPVSTTCVHAALSHTTSQLDSLFPPSSSASLSSLFRPPAHMPRTFHRSSSACPSSDWSLFFCPLPRSTGHGRRAGALQSARGKNNRDGPPDEPASNGPGTTAMQTDRKTDRQTDRQMKEQLARRTDRQTDHGIPCQLVLVRWTEKRESPLSTSLARNFVRLCRARGNFVRVLKADIGTCRSVWRITPKSEHSPSCRFSLPPSDAPSCVPCPPFSAPFLPCLLYTSPSPRDRG